MHKLHRVAFKMFAKVVVILALAFVAAAYQGLEVPGVYGKTQYGVYHPYQELIKSVVGYPYPYYGYGIEGEQGYVTPVGYFGSYPYYQYSSYYPQYVNNWPINAKYYPVSYTKTTPYGYGSSPFWSKITGDYYGYGGKYYTGVPDYLTY